MKSHLILTLGTALLFAACSTDPQPINFGKDLCVHCNMTIMDNKFGAEMINSKGKAVKFDSGECMINFLRSEQEFNPSRYLIVDYNSNGDLINATDAVFLCGGSVNSPMGGHLAAFKSPVDAEQTRARLGGEIMTWDEINKLDF